MKVFFSESETMAFPHCFVCLPQGNKPIVCHGMFSHTLF